MIFNKNLLLRINRELGGTFDVGAFRHEARWNADAGRIEMHLASMRAQTAYIEGIDLAVDFAAGETIHTENSYKYTHVEIEEIARGAGLVTDERWLDAGERFAVYLLARAGL